jgi:hypothetical protein
MFTKILKIKNKKNINLLNIPIGKFYQIGFIRMFKFFFGLLYIKINKYSLEYKIRLFGCTIYKNKNSDSLKYKALYRILKKKKLLYKNIYIFTGSPSGELYIILNLINAILKNKLRDDVLFVVDKKFKKVLCKLYCPDISCIIENKINLFVFDKSFYSYKDVSFFSLFVTKHYLEQDKKINKIGIHYYEYIRQDLGIKDDVEFHVPKISRVTQEKIKKYVNKNELNNFIILSPEANTSSVLSKKFLQTLCAELNKKSYKVFLNIMHVENYIDDCYVNYFSYDEIIELSKYAKAIIGLRSGLIDILSTLDIDIHCFYTAFPKRGYLEPMSSENALKGFSLKKMPNTNKDRIFEYDINKISEEQLLKIILSNIK